MCFSTVVTVYNRSMVYLKLPVNQDRIGSRKPYYIFVFFVFYKDLKNAVASHLPPQFLSRFCKFLPEEDAEFQFSRDVEQTRLRKPSGWNSPNSPVQLGTGPEKSNKKLGTPTFILVIFFSGFWTLT